MIKLFNFFKKIPQDKLLHYIFGLQISQIIQLFTLNIGIWNSVLLLFLVVSTLAIGKECYDKSKGFTIDYYDIIATLLGGSVNILYSTIIRGV